MSIQERISQEIEDLHYNRHVIKTQKTNANSYLIYYRPHQIQSPYRQLQYKIQLTIPENYPEMPPSLKFLDRIYHVNISPTNGQVRMSVLQDDWSSFLSLSSIIQSLDRVLEEPEEGYPADSDVLYEYRHKKKQYLENINKSYQKPQDKKFDIVICNSARRVEQSQVYSESPPILKESLSLEKKLQTIERNLQASNAYLKNIEQNQDVDGSKIDLIPASRLPTSSKQQGIIIYSKNNQQKVSQSINIHNSQKQSLSQNKNYLNSSINPTMLKINSMISGFIEQINEIQRQMEIIKNRSVYEMLEEARNQQISLLRQLLKVSEDAKKKMIENARNEIRKI